ncbi:ABC transporter substrate-binding protein [Roseomonas sp. BN140053]|uniref:ABC transporter substrate-binding protein n=1 Tax=Roseomonas sp. BN140053 TaxID=3391898 RepID=UPI0039EABCD6
MSLRAALLGFGAAVALTVSASAQNILIGVGAPTTGAAAAAAVWQRWGLDIAADRINGAGGVLGRPIEIRSYDNRCNPSEAVNVTNRLIEDKVVAILGMHCSSATLAAMPLIQTARIPMIEAIASSPRITELSGKGGNSWTFRINPSDQDMMDGLGQYLADSGRWRRFAVLGEDTDFGRGGAAAFQVVAQRHNLQIISQDFHPQSLPDFTSLLTRIRQSRPDAIAIFQLAGDQANMLRNAMQMGLRIPYAGRFDPGGNNAQIIAAGGMENSITAWTYSAEIDTPENRILVEETRRRFNSEPLLQTWAGYDTLRLAAQAITEAGSADPEKVRDALQRIRFGNVLGQEVSFDENNQGGRTVVIERVANRRVVVEKLLQLQR